VRTNTEAGDGVYLGSIDGGPARLLTNSSSGARFLPPDQVLFLSEGTLLARTLDSSRGELTGDPTVVAEHVAASTNFYGAFSAAQNGAIAYARQALTSELVWKDRGGHVTSSLGTGKYVDFRLSPDNLAAAIAETRDAEYPDIYVRHFTRGENIRITSDRTTDASPVWSPDLRFILFRSNRAGSHDLYIRDAKGSGPEQRFLGSDRGKYPTSWSPAGEILFHTRNARTKYDVMIADVEKPGASQLLFDSPFNDMQGQFSPDGKWIAYTSDVSSEFEVYVRARTGVVSRPVPRQVSIKGGTDPHWRADGRELFYRSAAGQLVAVRLRLGAGGIEAIDRQELFPLTEENSAPYISSYDVSPNGQQFLLRVPREHFSTTPLTVVLHWAAGQPH